MSETQVVLHLIDSFGVGGAQRRYFNDLMHFGHHFEHWPCAVFDDGLPPQVSPLPPHARALGITHIGEIPIAVGRLIRLLHANPRIALIHTQLFAADQVGRLAAAACGRPVVSTVQSAVYEPDSGLYSRWRHQTDRVTSRIPARVIAVSDAVRQSVHRRLDVPAGKIVVIPNTVDSAAVKPDVARRTEMRAALGLGDGTFAWLTVGRLNAAKGLSYLLSGFASVVAACPSTVVLIAGSGPSLDGLRQLATDAGVTDHVRFLGARSDVLALLDAADAFVFPSLSEGLPVAVLEAMAMEKACVLSRIGPHEELIEDGVSGVLVETRSAEGLTRGMLQIQQSPQLAREFGARARTIVVERFDARRCALQLEALYGVLVREPNR